jgi:hypothetical protein
MLIGDFVNTPHGTAQILNFKENDRLLVATLNELHTVGRSDVGVASFAEMCDLVNSWWFLSW